MFGHLQPIGIKLTRTVPEMPEHTEPSTAAASLLL